MSGMDQNTEPTPAIALKHVHHHKPHIAPTMNDQLQLVASNPGPGGAFRRYDVAYAEPPVEPGAAPVVRILATLNFQDGDPAVAINGITDEVLLAVTIDRLSGFLTGPYPTREAAVALTKLQEALQWLNTRTRERQQRGVLGQQAK